MNTFIYDGKKKKKFYRKLFVLTILPNKRLCSDTSSCIDNAACFTADTFSIKSAVCRSLSSSNAWVVLFN